MVIGVDLLSLIIDDVPPLVVVPLIVIELQVVGVQTEGVGQNLLHTAPGDEETGSPGTDEKPERNHQNIV